MTIIVPWLRAVEWPTRLNVGIMMFLAAFTTYLLRINMSINILGMVKSSNNTDRTPDYGPRYDWDAREQGIILGAYFWGYMLTQLPGGILAVLIGGRYVIGIALVLSAIATILIPFVADLSFWAVFVARFSTGLLGGGTFPSIQYLISKWAPQNERGKFLSTFIGGILGTVVTWPIAGWLMVNYGWASAFHVPALITLMLTVLWFCTVYNRPADHPRISSTEKEFIEKSVGDGLSKNNNKLPPLKKLVTSMPLWALLILHYGDLWPFYCMLIGAPKYMNEVLHFDLSNAGIVASLPNLVQMLTSFAFGAAGDWLVKSNKFQKTTIRKCLCIFSHILPGIAMFSMGYVGSNPYACVAVLTIASAFGGAAVCTNLQNSQELSPNYAAIIFSIINLVGSTNGITAPMVIAYFTREKSTVDEWNIIFMISAVFYIVSAGIFIVFGTTDVQEWNDPDAATMKNHKKEKDVGEGGQVEDGEM